jgi:hypothetical protein
MTIQELFIRSNEELKKVIDQIRDDQWSIDMPAGLTRNPSSLMQAVKYHSYNDAWVPDTLIGKTKEEVGDVYEEILIDNSDIKGVYAAHNAAAIEAVRSFTDLDAIVHLSYGDFPAREYLQHITIFRTLRSYDLAKLIGIDSTMEPAFVQGLLAEYPSHLDQYRQYGIIPAALSVPEGADPQTQFLGMVGRT